MKLFLYLFCFISAKVFSQTSFSYTIPAEFGNNWGVLSIDEKYGLISLSTSGVEKFKRYVLFNKIDGTKISEFNCSKCNMSYEGGVTTETDVYVFTSGYWNDDKGNFAIKFGKKAGSFPFVTKFVIDENLGKKDQKILSFTHGGAFHQVYLLDKTNEIVQFSITSPNKIKGEKFSSGFLDSKVDKNINFKFLGNKKEFILPELSYDYRAFVVDGLLTLVKRNTNTSGEKSLTVMQLGSGKKYTKTFAKNVDFFSGYILGDNLIIANRGSEKFVGDQINIAIVDWKTGKELKEFKFNSKSDNDDIESIYRSPVYDSDGDSLDHKWVKPDWRKKLYNVFDGLLYIGASMTSNGDFLITLVNEGYTTGAGGVTPMGGGAGGVPIMVPTGGGSTPIGTGNYKFINLLISGKNYELLNGPFRTKSLNFLIDKRKLEEKKSFIHFDKEQSYKISQTKDLLTITPY